MRKFYLVVLLACVAFFVHSQDAVFYKLPHGTAPVIDGTADAFWSGIESHNITSVNNGSTAPTPNTATWKAAWNDTAIFVIVKVVDDNHCDQWCSGLPDWDSDRINMFFDVNDNLKDGLGASSISSGHYIISPSYQQNINQFSKTEPGYSDSKYTYGYKITVDTVVYEYSILFSSLLSKNKLSLNPYTIDTIAFDVTINDRDQSFADNRIASWINKVNSWNIMDGCGKVVFKSVKPSIVALNKDNLAFNLGFTPLNQKKDTTITITNFGQEDLIISSVSVSGTGYTAVAPTDLTLSHLEKQSIKISFQGSTLGKRSGVLAIASNDPYFPNKTVDLITGNGINTIDSELIYGRLKKDHSPYLVCNNLTIPKDSTLIIDPGVVLKFNGFYNITVKGVIQARGIQNDSIRFTPFDTTGYSDFNSNNGAWNGIVIEYNSSTDTSKFEYCIMEYAKLAGNNPGRFMGPALLAFYANPVKISNSIFQNNFCRNDGGAVTIYSSNVVINNTIFKDNTALYDGGALLLSTGSKFRISNCRFVNNKANSGGGLAIISNSNGVLSHSIIANNISTDVGGGLNIVTSNCYILNNIISNNESYSASGGGGIVINNSRPTFYNNNICFNRSNNNSSGVLIWDISPAVFTNNIFWGNYGLDGSNFQINITNGQPTFNNCIVQGGFYKGIDKSVSYNGDTSTIFNVDPNFLDGTIVAGIGYNALNAKWNVDLESFVINNGASVPLGQFSINKDIYGKERIIHSVIDIGAVETHISSSNVSGVITSDTVWVADTIKVTGNLRLLPEASLTIAPGTIVEFQGHYRFKVHGAIKAIGLPNAMIKFTVKDTAGFANESSKAGSWNGLSINNGYWDGANYLIPESDSLIFDYVIVEYVKNMASNWDTTVGGGIQIKYFSKVRISNSIIRNNIATNGSGILVDGFSNPVILNNKIFNNKATSSGGGIFVGGNSNPLIHNNYIFNNLGEAGLYINTSNPSVIGNVIFNNKSNYYAGGVYLITSNPVFSNNTIVNNYAAWEGGGICAFDCNPKIYNTILWGNKAELRGSALNTQNNPVLYNCIIEGGVDNLFPGTVQNINTVTANPSFKNANTEVGLSKKAITSDWSITSFSSAINKAVIPPFALPGSDISGNNRINQEKLDIGAFENMDLKLEFVKQPVGSVLCVGDSITLKVITSDTALYQWQKDGTDLTNANASSLKLNGVTENTEGNYSCIIYNAYGKTFGNPAFIKVRTKPEIIEQSKGTLIQKEAPVTLQVRAEGSKPLYFKWRRDNVILTDTGFNMEIEKFRAENEGNYKCTVSNNCGSTTSDSVGLYLAPSICMVTVSSPTANGKSYNTIVWEKDSKISYAKYAIYRESTVAGFYDKIGTVNSTQPSVFSDTLVDPREQSFLYKITGIKSDNSETDINLSKVHKTIHLLVTAGLQGGVQLDWDQYIGFPYSTYYIYKSTDGNSFTKFDSISTSSRTWTDLNATVNTDPVYYYISVKNADPCNPGGVKKAGSDVFGQSVSNIEDNRLRAGVNVTNTDIKKSIICYPNPFSNFVNIKYNLNASENVSLEIYDEIGKVVALIVREKQHIGSYEYIINTNELGLMPGIFTLRFTAGNEVILNKLVKIK